MPWKFWKTAFFRMQGRLAIWKIAFFRKSGTPRGIFTKGAKTIWAVLANILVSNVQKTTKNDDVGQK